MYCFVFMYLISFVIVMSSEDWFMVWMGLEINMMSFLILIYKRYSMMTGESCLSYFFIQSMGSSLFISFFYLQKFLMGGVLISILSLKIGAGPFFFWFPSLCSGLDWVSCYFLMLFQKVLPLVLIFLFIHWILWLIVVMSLVFGVLGSFNQSNIKYLMAYSSIHHLGWIMMVGMLNNTSWILYLMMYGMVLFSVVVLLFKDDIIDLSYFYISKYKVIYMISMLSMGGVPPLLGFYLKWMALINIINLGMIYLFMLVMVSVIMLYVYIRIMYDIFMGGGVELMYNWMDSEYVGNVEMVSIIGMMMGFIFMLLFV